MGEQVAARIKEKREQKLFKIGNRKKKEGGLAQLGEHLPCKQGVESSNLLVSMRHRAREGRKRTGECQEEKGRKKKGL